MEPRNSSLLALDWSNTFPKLFQTRASKQTPAWIILDSIRGKFVNKLH